MDKAAQKEALRREMFRLRAEMSPDERLRREKTLCERLYAELAGRLEAADGSGSPGLVYFPFGTEPDLTPVVESLWRLGAPLAAPRSLRRPNRLEWRLVRGMADLQPGVWGIREPKPECPLVREEEALRAPFILVPGVAFDARGGRLGYGGGYYDRFLARRPEAEGLIAAAFELQLVPEVPTEEHDKRVGVLVTEQRRLRCGDAPSAAD